MKQYLLRHKTLLWETYVSLLKLGTAMVVFVLFFLWYPDFISWFFSKLPTPSGFLAIIPAFVLVWGLSFGIFFGFMSLSNWRELQKTTETKEIK